MGERKIRPFGRMSKSVTVAMVVVFAAFYATMVPMLVILVGLKVRNGGSGLDIASDLWYMVLGMIGLPLLGWFQIRRVMRTEWTIGDKGIQTPAVFGQPFGTLYAWENAIEIGYGLVAPWLNKRRVIFATFAGIAQPLQVAPEGLSPDDLRSLLSAIVSFAPRDSVTTDLLVLESLQRLSAKLVVNGGPGFSVMDRPIGEMRLAAAERELGSPAALSHAHGQFAPVLTLMRAQVAWLTGEHRQAREMAAPLAARFPTWTDACLVAGLATASQGDVVRGAALIAAGVPDAPAAVAKEAASEAQERKEQAKARTLWLVFGGFVYVLVSAGLIVGLPLLATSGAFEGPVARAVLRLAEPVFIAIQVVMILLVVVFTARKKRRAAEKPTAARRPVPTILPENTAHVESARQQAWGAIVFFVGGALLLGGTQLVAVLWPHVLAGENGRFWARATLSVASVLVMLVSAALIVRAIGTGALERLPSRGGTGGATGGDRDGGSLLNADIRPGWAAAALVPLVLFGAGALAVNMMDPGVAQYLAADANGTRYAIMGSSVVAWDGSGRILRDFSYKGGPGGVGMPWDLAADDQGAVYITDASEVSVSKFGPDGAFAASFDSAGDPLSREISDFNLSCAPTGDGVLVLDEGVLYRVTQSGREQVFALRELAYAEDFAVAGERIVVADTANGRLLSWREGVSTSSDCLAFEDGYRYPVHVEAASDGRVFAVLSKAWDDREARRPSGRPFGSGAAPVVWMGRLYVWDTDGGEPRHLPVEFRGLPINIGDIAVLPDGRLLVSSLNEGWLYEVDPADPRAARRLDTGEIGERLRTVDRNLRITDAGPQVLLSLAIVIPVGVGMAGVTLGRRRRGNVGPTSRTVTTGL